MSTQKSMIARRLSTIAIPHVELRHVVLALCLVILTVQAIPMLSVRYQCATPDTCDDGDELRLVQAVVALNFTLELAAYYATSGPLAGRSAMVPIFFTLAGIALATRCPLLSPVRPSGAWLTP